MHQKIQLHPRQEDVNIDGRQENIFSRSYQRMCRIRSFGKSCKTVAFPFLPFMVSHNRVRVWIWFLLPLNLSTLYFVCQRACMHMRAHAYMHTHAELAHSWLRLWPLTVERCPTFRIFCQPASDTEQTSNSPFKPGTVTICTKLQPHLELT